MWERRGSRRKSKQSAVCSNTGEKETEMRKGLGRNCTHATAKMKDTHKEGRISPVGYVAITQVLELHERNEWRFSTGCQ